MEQAISGENALRLVLQPDEMDLHQPAIQNGKHTSNKPNRGGMLLFPPPRDALVWMRGAGGVDS